MPFRAAGSTRRASRTVPVAAAVMLSMLVWSSVVAVPVAADAPLLFTEVVALVGMVLLSAALQPWGADLRMSMVREVLTVHRRPA